MPDDSLQDLLRPTLTEDDNAVDFGNAWNPHSLAIVTFFAGLICGGILFFLNAARLGIERRGWILPTAIAASLLLHFLAATLSITYGTELRREIGIGAQVVAVLVALGFAATQRRRYRVFQGSDAEPGKLLVPGLIAAAVGMFIVNKASIYAAARIAVFIFGAPADAP